MPHHLSHAFEEYIRAIVREELVSVLTTSKVERREKTSATNHLAQLEELLLQAPTKRKKKDLAKVLDELHALVRLDVGVSLKELGSLLEKKHHSKRERKDSLETLLEELQTQIATPVFVSTRPSEKMPTANHWQSWLKKLAL